MKKEVLNYYLHKEGAALKPDLATREERRKFRKLKRQAAGADRRLDAYLAKKHKDSRINTLRRMAKDLAAGCVIVRDSDFSGFSHHGYAYYAKVLAVSRRAGQVRGVQLFCTCEITGLHVVNFSSAMPPRKNGARIQVEVSLFTPGIRLGPYGPLLWSPEQHVETLLADEAQLKHRIQRKMQRLTELEQLAFSE